MAIEIDVGAVLSCVMVSLMQEDSLLVSSLNLTYTVAVALDCPRVQEDFDVA